MSSSDKESESWSLGSVEATGSVQGKIKRFSSFSKTGDEEDNYVAPWHERVGEGKKESLSLDVWPSQTLNEALENCIPKGRNSNINRKIMKEMSDGYGRMEMTAASFEKSNDAGGINEEEETGKNYSMNKKTIVEKMGTNLRMDQTSNRTVDQGEIGLGADGLGKKHKREIRKLVGKEQVEFLMLQETKMGNVDKGICREMWGTKNFEWVAKNAEGSARGLLCLWNCEIFVLDKSFQGPGLLGVYGFWGIERVPCCIINVYALCDSNGKRDLWCNRSNIANNNVIAMCVGGDFNVTISQEEKKGCRGNQKEMEGFEEFIAETGLIDLPMIGRSFTWYQPNEKAMSCLDRFLMNEEWLTTWQCLKHWGLKRSISDHCPMLLKNEMKNWGPKPFRFFNAWLRHP
ncbi:hypothetical protein SLEP1_g23214 [Rubroshorea leprosula]|uniref:Endonuclease/exonuclease/phosphatase domain-containing protein n=1 Tax=Rubroshorea leprosula TaxID=152421 RepID=A0AAV5JBR5_9ROSI|nr:hypothetical protein SLEP1_g23214 [Rubroshorea leprosula]